MAIPPRATTFAATRRIAALTFDGVDDKDTAKGVAHDMAWLAGSMLLESRAGDWDFRILE